MHLALAIGGYTLDELDERMTETEFQMWQTFSRQYFLPRRSMELQLAQVSYLVALGGAKAQGNVNLSEFVVAPALKQSEETAEVGGAVIGAMSSKRVHILGQKRKAKELGDG